MSAGASPQDYFEHLARLDGACHAQVHNAWQACCGDHLGADREALCWVDLQQRVHRYSFEQLDRWSAQFAHLLVARGVRPGDRVAGLLPRRLELLVVVLGCWRAGAVYQPLFTAFGPKSIQHRLDAGQTRLLVAHRDQLDKLAQIADLPALLPLDATEDRDDDAFWIALAGQPTTFAPVVRAPDDAFLMMFTSGTSGLPKGLMVPLRAMRAFAAYMRDAVGLREHDVLWNIADPGWAYGLYYAITGPLLLGHATTFHEGAFTPESCYRTIAALGVTNLMGSPTAFRMLMAAGPAAAAAVKGQLRAVSSAGEPLNPEVIRWFDRHLGTLIHDHYGQTETGMTVCNHHGLAHPVRSGSAGYALPGYRVAVLDGAGAALPPGVPGQLAIDVAGSPALFFAGYWQQPRQPFADGYYLTGDTVERNDDGSISFVGRSDDVITSSGYRIGPFDVESSLIEHPDVVEAAVVGKPDRQRSELVVAYVVLRDGLDGDDALAAALAQFVKQRLSAHAYPREVHFVAELPKTPSGKIQRFLLRQTLQAQVQDASA
jgi:acetyl-CoA synthetase